MVVVRFDAADVGAAAFEVLLVDVDRHLLAAVVADRAPGKYNVIYNNFMLPLSLLMCF